jgi:hypothetical protein
MASLHLIHFAYGHKTVMVILLTYQKFNLGKKDIFLTITFSPNSVFASLRSIITTVLNMELQRDAYCNTSYLITFIICVSYYGDSKCIQHI